MKNSIIVFLFLLICSVTSAQKLANLYKEVSSSVVVINTKSSAIKGIQANKKIVTQEGQGSGVLISKEGHIWTAAHVVQSAEDITIEFTDGDRLKAEVLSSIPNADVAILKISSPFQLKNKKVVPIGDSNKLQIGEDVFILGAPHGFKQSLTRGILSGRFFPDHVSNDFNEIEFLQTDAAINPGNSGGPMFNMKGEVMGITSSIYTTSGGFQGIGFVISSNTAKSSLDRIKSLYEKGSSSLSDYEKARNSYQSAKDQYDSAKKSRDIQKSKVDYGYIYAPKTGVIAKKNIGKNENVSAGQVIATLNAGTDLNVKVGLPESIINKTKLGMVAKLKFSAIEDKTFEGSVIEISPVVDGNTSLYPVELDIKNPGNVIKPGMAVSITFNFNDDSITDNTLIIPVKAVGEDANGNFVFVVSSEDGKTGTVKKKTIEIGTLTSIGFEVKSGLNAGDKIATAGLQTLLDGQKVKLND